MPKQTIEIQVSTAWWLKLYKFGLVTVCMLTGLEPDWQKVERVIKRGIRIRIV